MIGISSPNECWLKKNCKRVFRTLCLALGIDRLVGFVCCRCIRTEPRKVAFASFWGRGFADNPKYVALELLRRRPDLDLVWLCNNQAAVAKTLPHGIRTAPYGGLGGLREAATAAVRVDNQVINLLRAGFEKKPDQLYVQTWHGSLGIKRIGFDFAPGRLAWKDRHDNRVKDGAMVDALISNSDFESEIYRQQWFGGGTIHLFGHPRNDILVNGLDAAAVQNVRARLGVPEAEKLLLYAPTFRDDVPGYDYSFDAAAVLAAAEKRFGGIWRLAVRRHPKMSQQAFSRFSGPSMLDVSDYPDMQELLCVAEALMTDYSSCMFDFMLTGRPVFVYAPDLERYETDRGFYYPISETPFPVARTEADLAAAVANFDEPSYRDRCAAFLKGKGCVEDGRAAERTADLILRWLDEQHPSTCSGSASNGENA